MQENKFDTITVRLHPKGAGQPNLIVCADGHTDRVMEMSDNGLVDYTITENMTTHRIKIEITPKEELYARSINKPAAEAKPLGEAK